MKTNLTKRILFFTLHAEMLLKIQTCVCVCVCVSNDIVHTCKTALGMKIMTIPVKVRTEEVERILWNVTKSRAK